MLTQKRLCFRSGFVLRLIVFALLMVMMCGQIPAAHAAECIPPEEQPTLRVEVEAEPPLVDHVHPRVSLKQFDIATISPYGTGRNVHVNGLMRGAITLKTEMGISWQRTKSDDDSCYWFNNIHVSLKLNPTIYIAQEIDENSCLYQEVLKHEYKHYQTDLETAKDYQLVLQEEVEAFMHQTGVIGPFPKDLQDQPKQELIKRLEAVMQSVNSRMKLDRTKRQAKLDTREEYERVTKACPGDQGMM